MEKGMGRVSGRLSIVATPIGNLEDITLRALRVLKEADVVAAEDTRVTRKLLSHFGIAGRLVSFHANSGESGYAKLLDLLEGGARVALVSDAGTPGVSDPGGELVARAREALPDVTIEAIPGPSSLTAALSIAGLKAPSFTFYGFLPQKKGRETLIKRIAADERASVFLESTHRIMKCLESLAEHAPQRRIGLYRELTKLHEEALVGMPQELIEAITRDPNRERGEFVVIVEGE